jgi:hypothetical protein
VSNPKKRAMTPKDPAEALAQIETPKVKWQVIAQIAGGLAVLWVTAFMAVPWVSYFGVGVVGLLTLAALGFGVYVWRLTNRQRNILEIMKSATDDAGRKRAIAELGEGGKGSDAMKAVAKAQLLAATDPAEAQRVLEAVDIKKAPMMVQDEVRAQLARCGWIASRNPRPRHSMPRSWRKHLRAAARPKRPRSCSIPTVQTTLPMRKCVRFCCAPRSSRAFS